MLEEVLPAVFEYCGSISNSRSKPFFLLKVGPPNRIAPLYQRENLQIGMIFKTRNSVEDLSYSGMIPCGTIFIMCEGLFIINEYGDLQPIEETELEDVDWSRVKAVVERRLMAVG